MLVAVLKAFAGYWPAYHPVTTAPQWLVDTGELATSVPAGSRKRNHMGVLLLKGDVLSHELIVAV